MAYKVFIDGREGTTGLKIHTYFKQRQDIALLEIEDEKRKDLGARLELVGEADITFLCLPDQASREIATHGPKGSRILDTSTAHRVDPDWVYGLPELCSGQRQRIREANRVAVPGCHATGFILLAKPLIASGLTGPDYPFACHSVTGYSGGGKQMIADYQAYHSGKSVERRLGSPRQYGLSQDHKHLPEMVAMAGTSSPPIFNPIVSDFYSGMMVGLPLHPAFFKKKATLAQVAELYASYYAGQPMIEVKTEGEELESGFLSADGMADKNGLEILIYGNDERMMLAARYDNLGKGASGAAVQCMNLMLGMEETTGLV